jgi:hypothetical protein
MFCSNGGTAVPSGSKFCVEGGCLGCPVSAIISVPGPTIHQSNAVLLPNLKPMSLLDIFLTSQCELVLGIWLRRNMAKEK